MRRTAFVAIVVLMACHHRRPSVQPIPVRGPARDTLMRLDRSRTDSSAAHGPIAALLSLLDRDAAYQRAGAPTVYGRENIRVLLLADTTPASTRFAWQPLAGELSADRNAGYTFGIAVRADSGAAKRMAFERYIAFWRRAAGRPWRLVAYAEVGGPLSSIKSLPLQSPPLPPEMSRHARRILSELISTDSAFSDLADRAGIAAAFSSNVAPEGVVLSGADIVTGPRDVREFYATGPSGNTLTWRPLDAFVAGSEDLGYTIGEYVATGRGPSGAAVQSFGKYITVWKKQPNDGWKFVVDGASSESRD